MLKTKHHSKNPLLLQDSILYNFSLQCGANIPFPFSTALLFEDKFNANAVFSHRHGPEMHHLMPSANTSTSL